MEDENVDEQGLGFSAEVNMGECNTYALSKIDTILNKIKRYRRRLAHGKVLISHRIDFYDTEVDFVIIADEEDEAQEKFKAITKRFSDDWEFCPECGSELDEYGCPDCFAKKMGEKSMRKLAEMEDDENWEEEEQDDSEKLLWVQTVENVDRLDIGADGDRFYLDIVEDKGSGGVRVELSEEEREAIRRRFDVPDREDVAEERRDE